MPARRAAPTTLLALTAQGLGCTAAAPPEPAGPPDIVLLVVSGLRADSPDQPGAETAFYEGFGSSPGLRFSSAYAQSCVPFTSMGSLLGGRYPSAMAMCATHDVNAFVMTHERPWCARIPEAVWTLPEVLGVYGYQTAAYVAAISPTLSTDWADIQRHAAGWWADHADTPRLYLIQTLDLHMLQFDALAGYSEQNGALDRRTGQGSAEELRAEYVRRAQDTGTQLRGLLDTALVPSAERPLEVWVTSTNGLSLREETGLASDHLRAVTNTVIVDRTIHVPLARLLPAAPRPREDDTVVELLDLMPTLVVRAGGQIPAGAQGRDLLSDTPDPAPRAYAEFGDMLALREGDDLLTFRFFLHNASALDPRLTEGLRTFDLSNSKFYALHDVVADPLQARERLSQERARAEAMRQVLLEIRTGPGAPAPEELTAERLEALRLSPANGYW